VEQRECGRSGLTLSVLGLGCWAFGGGEYWGPVEQSDVDAVVRRAFELGITYFDTAEVYNDGRSEASLGRAIGGLPREQVVIGTKVSPAHVQPDVLPGRCDASLRRLGTDYIDIYMVHCRSRRARSVTSMRSSRSVLPWTTPMRRWRGSRSRARLRHIGVSNFARPRLEEALAYCPNLAVNELPYNLLSRAIEWEALPASRELGLGVIGYMALLQGVLADLYPTLDDIPAWQRRTRHFDARKTAAARHGLWGEEHAMQQTLGPSAPFVVKMA
jgi:myo-inositol catabolism protein IolS